MRHFWGRGRTRSRRTRPRKTRRRRNRRRKTRRGKRTVRGGVGRQFGGVIDCGCSRKEGSTFHCFCDDEDGNNKTKYREKSRKLDVVDYSKLEEEESQQEQKFYYKYGSSEQIKYEIMSFFNIDDFSNVRPENKILKYLISGHLCLSIFFKNNESIQMYFSTGTSNIDLHNQNFFGIFFPRPDAGFVRDILRQSDGQSRGYVQKCYPKDLWFSIFIKYVFRIIFNKGQEKIDILDRLINDIEIPKDINLRLIYFIFDSVRSQSPIKKQEMIEEIENKIEEYFIANNLKYNLVGKFFGEFEFFYNFFKKFCYWRDVQVSAMLGWDTLKQIKIYYFDKSQEGYGYVTIFDKIKNFVLSHDFVFLGKKKYGFQVRKQRKRNETESSLYQEVPSPLTELSLDAQILVRKYDDIDKLYSLDEINTLIERGKNKLTKNATV